MWEDILTKEHDLHNPHGDKNSTSDTQSNAFIKLWSHSMNNESAYLVVVVGAGPAGLSVANSLSEAGHQVIVLNRDIKFGGLAEYGIFPSKIKLRGGLKKQYWEILNHPNVHYFGNVAVGKKTGLTLEDLRGLGANAVVFATGAQGTKSIGLEGETATGVYHAKDVVFHFNQLPGFGDQPFEMGQHIAIIGVGDVMVDIAHWLIRYKRVEKVTAIARRGPAERKYHSKELKAINANIPYDDLVIEFSRIRPRLEAAGQNVEMLLQEMQKECQSGVPAVSETRMGFRFLASPRRVLTDAANRVRAIEIEETRLEAKDGNVSAVGTNQTYEFPCDSVIFAVGDKVDESIGLPYRGGLFTTNPVKTGLDPDDALFQVFDEQTGQILDGVFVTGWARKASDGLVGVAKRDGEWCAEVVCRYLEGQARLETVKIDQTLQTLRQKCTQRGINIIEGEDLRLLDQAEQTQPATSECIGTYKASTNEEMFALMNQ
jgi:ferredoxin/flavodoxin---NADP+ reductase